MALTADQSATLQLLLERGQSYPDLARVLGVDEGEVRSRARAALADLGGADPDRNVPLTDYLLGQADPIGRADAVRHLRDDPDDLALAGELVEKLRAEYPSAELPRLPGEARPSRRARPAGDQAGRGLRLPSLSTSQARVAAILTAGGVILVVAILAVAGVFGGDDESTPPAETSPSADTETGSGGEEIERVSLRSPSGGDATGDAVFGLIDDNQPYVDLNISGLDPAPGDKTYVFWLLLNRDQGYPLTPIAVANDGSFQDRFAIPAAVLPVVARVKTVDISLAPVNQVRDIVRDAIRSEKLVIDRPGETVLAGAVPRLEQPQGGSE